MKDMPAADFPGNISTVKTAESLFFPSSGHFWTPDEVRQHLDGVLHSMDDGELFLEYRDNETLAMEDGVLRQASFNQSSGFGLRAVRGEQTFFAHSGDLDLHSLKNASASFTPFVVAFTGRPAVSSQPAAQYLSDDIRYEAVHPLSQSSFAERAALLAEIEAYGRALDPRIMQVNPVLKTEWQVVQIIRPDFLQTGPVSPGKMVDIRPLIRLDISVIVAQDGRRERGTSGQGGRYALARLIAPSQWQEMTKEALRQALLGLEARPAPAGEMPVILGAGWPGILLHEAVGHGLEGDFNRKGTSVFSDMIGQRIAAQGVTVVDDGTLKEERGSLMIDDEGTPAGRVVQIEDGILKTYIHDRLSARLTGQVPTGNGRRESYAHAPMPRMTNTVMLPGTATEEEMIKTVKKGLYAVNFGGGQVDITSGQFVFAASEAYLVENGRVTAPVRGATLIGKGADVMQKIDLVGQDSILAPGIGTCGKAGQQVPVGVGQPLLRVSGLTVGGVVP